MVQQERTAEQLRNEIKEEMKREIFGLLQSFDSKWVQRFDEFLLQQTTLVKSRDETCVSEFADSFAQLALPVSKPDVFLADFVSKPQDLSEFRDINFPQLRSFDDREKYIRASERRLNASDYQHSVTLLRHADIRAWVCRLQITSLPVGIVTGVLGMGKVLNRRFYRLIPTNQECCGSIAINPPEPQTGPLS